MISSTRPHLPSLVITQKLELLLFVVKTELLYFTFLVNLIFLDMFLCFLISETNLISSGSTSLLHNNISSVFEALLLQVLKH
jgi:hypothetical protein